MSIARGEGHQVISHAGTAAGVDLTRLSTVLERFRFEAGSSAAFDISSVRGLTPLFNAIADKVEPLIDFDRLSMALRLGSTKSVETVFVRGIEVNSRPVGWSGDAAVDDPLDITYLDGAIIVEDLKKYEHRSEFTPFLDVGLRSWLEVPLGPVTSPIGWLSVRSSKLAAYGAAQQSLLKQIADMASPVIYQTSVVEAAVFQSRQTRSLSEISRLFSTTAELEAEFPKIAKYISLLIPADRMVLAHFDTVNQVLVDQYIWGVAIPIWDANRSHEYTPTIQQILDTKSGIVDNGSPNFNPEAEKQSLRSGMFAPLISDDHVLGVISVKSTRPYAYGPPDLEIFESIAQQIAGVTNLRNSNRQVTQQSAKFANLATLSRSAEEESELENSLRSLSELISQMFGADHVAIFLSDDEYKRTHSKIDLGSDFLASPVHYPWPSSQELLTERESSLSELLVKYGVNSAMSAPFGRRNASSIGHLVAISHQSEKFSAEDLDYFSLVGAQIAPSVQNRLSQQREIEAANNRVKMIELDEENKRLENEAQFKSDLISMLSHDLRTPLNAVMGTADILFRNRQQNLSDKQIRQLRTIQTGSRTLSFLIRDLLTASSVEADQLQLNPADVDIDQLLADLHSTFIPILDAKHQDLHISAEPSLSIFADRLKLLQILGNLVANASKYSDENSQVLVDVSLKRDRLFFEITDQGLGISPEDLPRLFDRYFRGQELISRGVEGSGLGLFIVKTLVDLHHGEISIDSKVGIGSKFSVTIPADPAAG